MARGTENWRLELRSRVGAGRSAAAQPIGATDEEDAAGLFRELQVHQLELEMQNEDLRRARRDAEHALARYLELYQLAPMAYVSLDPMGVFLEANRAAARLLSLTPDELLLSKLSSVVVRADEGDLERHLAASFAGAESQVTELRLRRGDGAERMVRLESVVVSVADGEPRCRSAMIDVTDLVGAETSTQRLAAAVADADDPIFLLDLSGRICSWNRGARDLYGVTDSDALGQSFARMVPREERAAFEDIRARLSVGERIRGIDAERVAGDGRRLVVSMAAFPMRGERERIDAVCFCERDVTPRRTAEASEATRAQLLGAVLEACPDGIILADERGRVEEINPAAERMFGRSAAQARGTAVLALMRPVARLPVQPLDLDGPLDLTIILGPGSGLIRGHGGDGASFPVRVAVHETRIAGRTIYCCFVRRDGQDGGQPGGGGGQF